LSLIVSGAAIDRIVVSFQHAARNVREKKTITEYDLKVWILKEFENAGIWAEEGPDIAVNSNASDPHFGPRWSPLPPIAKAICCCWMCGEKRNARRSNTSRGWAILAPKCRKNTPKFLGIVREAREEPSI